MGGDTAAAANTIAFNGLDGVNVDFVGQSNSVLGNSIFSNAEQGIDLNDDDRTFNDPGDRDFGGNGLQNFPVLNLARTPRRGGTIIVGSLNSSPDATFTVQFFANLPGEDEGRSFLGQTSVTTDSDGNAAVGFRSGRLPRGFTVTATATDASGNTSEFSDPTVVTQQKKKRKKRR